MSILGSDKNTDSVLEAAHGAGHKVQLDSAEVLTKGDTRAAELYNSLPSLEAALNSLKRVNFDEFLADVSDLLAPYGDGFGLSLIHRHFDLLTDEMMVENGDTMKPVFASAQDYVKVCEKRWDREGRAYEYSIEEQNPVPSKLLEDFRRVVPADASLGLYSRRGDDESVQWVEFTNDDQRCHWLVPRTEEIEGAPQTAWYSKDGRPLTRGCGSTCVSNGKKGGVIKKNRRC
ncbi:hypothetical protein I302_107090 [Kwoniella bestiolae CBS 10118]|uniref:Uncharacterized protein n=1 Tax=Kwoniella bestiolae CBS 10118 TaxID=1296100 RepID=A0A1B9FZJ0_9TREE|nr:hypothetical protein I302_05645 [Kwoniella bestiolae CBS 10118]OCF24186.1 hypothetical protein I302_05645 [Kwoniella bestiolae CBS 10118]